MPLIVSKRQKYSDKKKISSFQSLEVGMSVTTKSNKRVCRDNETVLYNNFGGDYIKQYNC